MKNAIQSMTAFGRAEHTDTQVNLSWELKTLNNRYLELNFKLPDYARSAEPKLRELAKQYLSRGKLEAGIKLMVHGQQQAVIDDTALQSLLQKLDHINASYPGTAQPTTLDILNHPGVLSEQNWQQLGDTVVNTFEAALKDLTAARQREGQQLKALIVQRVEEIEVKSAELENAIPDLQQKQHQKLIDKLQEYELDATSERIEQELIILANKSDVAEEIDRLRTHCQEIRRILDNAGACGRRLDFMMQELNREANTLGSKAVGSEVTQVAVDIKVLIEQMREQIQNLE